MQAPADDDEDDVPPAQRHRVAGGAGPSLTPSTSPGAGPSSSSRSSSASAAAAAAATLISPRGVVEAAEKLRDLLARRASMATDLAAVDAECTSRLAQCCDVARTDLGEVSPTSARPLLDTLLSSRLSQLES